MDAQPVGEERTEWPGLGGREDKCVGLRGCAGHGDLGPSDPQPRRPRGASGPDGAGGRAEGPAAGAPHKVFRNTAGRPAKFAAGLTRKRS